MVQLHVLAENPLAAAGAYSESGGVAEKNFPKTSIFPGVDHGWKNDRNFAQNISKQHGL